jgi:hypothetical protein
MTKEQRAKSAISAALDALNSQIQNAPPSGPGSNDQLNFMQGELRRYLRVIEDRFKWTGPTPDPVLTRIIVDSWPLASPLGEMVSDAERAYINLF